MSKIRNVAVQMDHVRSIRIAGDSTFAMSLEAQNRGYKLFHYTPDQLSMRDGVVQAVAEPMILRDVEGDHFELGPQEKIDLSSMDVVLLRQDPPFDMAYITSTHLLERVHPKTLVVNDPAWVRNSPEKIFVTEFPDLMPKTLISRDPATINAFRAEVGDMILKPLYGNGGAGVFHVKPDDRNLTSLLEMFAQMYREPYIAQEYLSDVRAGDKRIILIDGKPAGALNRVPAPGESRSNLHVGGTAEKAGLTSRDEEICASIGPALKDRGLIFAGIDVIGDYLTEINVTSPTCLQEINAFDGTRLQADIWDAIEARL